MDKIYKVVFDTNVLWHDNEDKLDKVFNSTLDDSVKFVVEHKIKSRVKMAIPEIVVQERIEQVLKQINTVVSKIETGLNALSGFQVKVYEKNYKKDYRKKITKKITNELNRLEIEILTTPEFNRQDLINRVLEGLCPFSKDSDKGLKDTLIWFALLEDAQKNHNINYIFCTKNIKDFLSTALVPEFESYKTGGKLVIFEDTKNVKEFLDTQLNLDLGLKEKFKKTEEYIRKNIGELMVQFHKKKSTDRLFGSTSFDPSSVFNFPSISLFENKNRSIIAYDFEDINFVNISPTDKDSFIVKAEITVIPRFKDEGVEVVATRALYSLYNIEQNYKKFCIEIEHNDTGIVLLSVLEIF